MKQSKGNNVLIFMGVAALFIVNPVLGFVGVGVYLYSK